MADPTSTPAAAPVTPPVTPVTPQATPPVTPPVEPTVTPVEPQKLTITEPQSISADLGNIVTELGFDLNEVDTFMDEHGKLPDQVRQELVKKYGEAAANMIVAQIDAQSEQHDTAAAAEDKVMFDHLAGAFEGITEQDGEATWKELKDWAGKNLGDEKDEINSMLSQGGFIAKQALDHMINKFKASSEFTQTAKLQTGDNLNNDHAQGGLDKAGYDRELRKLTDKGFAYTSPEVQRLQTRRTKAMRRGQ